MKHSLTCDLKVFAQMRNTFRCGDFYRKTNKQKNTTIYFKDVDAKEPFPLFFCQARCESPPPISVSRTLYSFSAHLIPVTTFRFLISQLPQTQTCPLLYTTRCASAPSPFSPIPEVLRAGMVSTHIPILHFTLSYPRSFTDWAMLSTSAIHFWFQVPCFLFSTNTFFFLYQTLNSVTSPKQTYPIFTLF